MPMPARNTSGSNPFMQDLTKEKLDGNILIFKKITKK